MKRQTIFFLVVMVTTAFKLHAQSVRFVKFIHGGDETKPIGTVVISVGGLVKATEKPMDDIYGRSIQTDTGTYRALIAVIRNGKHKTSANNFDPRDFFIIKTSDGFELDLDWPVYKSFFSDLHDALKDEDKAVYNVFKNYYPDTAAKQ